jgi:phosphoglycerate dehydrogenase-like enzyme
VAANSLNVVVDRIDDKCPICLDRLPFAARTAPATRSSMRCRGWRSSPSTASATDAVDLRHARARSVRVTTTPDVLPEDVADLALGLVLATSKRICVADHFARSGTWLHERLPLAAR